eukprot:m.192201 g.192201  ORF g.192201 m.192201 type:complete len:784 (-) comp17582_c1_seq2:499-2850(-)
MAARTGPSLFAQRWWSAHRRRWTSTSPTASAPAVQLHANANTQSALDGQAVLLLNTHGVSPGPWTPRRLWHLLRRVSLTDILNQAEAESLRRSASVAPSSLTSLSSLSVAARAAPFPISAIDASIAAPFTRHSVTVASDDAFPRISTNSSSISSEKTGRLARALGLPKLSALLSSRSLLLDQSAWLGRSPLDTHPRFFAEERGVSDPVINAGSSLAAGAVNSAATVAPGVGGTAAAAGGGGAGGAGGAGAGGAGGAGKDDAHHWRVREATLQKYRDMDLYLRRRGYNTLRVILLFAGVMLVVLYLLRNWLKKRISGQVVDLTSETLKDRDLHVNAEQFSKSIVTSILNDPQMSTHAIAFLQELFARDGTREALANLFSQVLQHESTRTQVAALMRKVIADLSADPYTNQMLATLIINLVNRPDTHEALKQAAITSVLENEEVRHRTTEFFKVTLQDQSLQSTSSQVLWHVVKGAVLPSFINKQPAPATAATAAAAAAQRVVCRGVVVAAAGLPEGDEVEDWGEDKGQGDDADAAVDVHEVAEKGNDDGDGHSRNKQAECSQTPAENAGLAAAVAQQVGLDGVEDGGDKDGGVDAVGAEHVEEEAGVGEGAQGGVGQVEGDGRLCGGAVCIETEEPHDGVVGKHEELGGVDGLGEVGRVAHLALDVGHEHVAAVGEDELRDAVDGVVQVKLVVIGLRVDTVLLAARVLDALDQNHHVDDGDGEDTHVGDDGDFLQVAEVDKGEGNGRGDEEPGRVVDVGHAFFGTTGCAAEGVDQLLRRRLRIR